jgi:hypothetical protein
MSTPKTVPLSETQDESPKSTTRKRIPARSAADKKLKDSLASVYVSTGLAFGGVSMIRGDPRFEMVGSEFVDKSDSLAEAWMKLADGNVRIKNALRAFVETSAIAELVGLHVACLAPFAMGVIPPAVLAGMRAQTEPTQNGHGSSD